MRQHILARASFGKSKLTNILLIAILVTSISGCTSWLTGTPQPQTLYVLASKICDNKGTSPAGAPTLLIGPPKASAFLYSTRIIFSRASQTRGSYQYAFWTDAPPDRLAINLEQELECRGPFSKVSRNSFPADYLVRFEVLDFRHDISRSPGEVSVELSAELLSAHNGLLLATQHFEVQSPATSYDALGAIDGFNTASRQIVHKMADWLTETVKRKKS